MRLRIRKTLWKKETTAAREKMCEFGSSCRLPSSWGVFPFPIFSHLNIILLFKRPGEDCVLENDEKEEPDKYCLFLGLFPSLGVTGHRLVLHKIKTENQSLITPSPPAPVTIIFCFLSSLVLGVHLISNHFYRRSTIIIFIILDWPPADN